MGAIKWILSGISKNYIILTIALALVVITIPLNNNYNSWAIVAFCILCFFHTPFPLSLRIAWKHKYWLLGILFFLWLCATWFWDSTGGFTVKSIESYCLFPFLPFVMITMPRLPARVVLLTCYIFVATIIVVCLICLFKSWMIYGEMHDSRVFYYHYLAGRMGLNAVYLSNYCTACICWLLFYQFIYSGERHFKIPSAIVFLICAFLTGMILLLSSKMGIFVFVLMMLSLGIYVGYTKKVLLKSLGILVIVGVVVFLLSEKLYYLKWRFSELSLKEYRGSEDDQNGLAVRVVIWGSALELIKERPILGYGLNGAKEELVKKHLQKKLMVAVPEKYNTHNQYLETTLRSGVIGLAILLLLIAFPLYSAIRERKTLLLLMLLHFMVVSLVETTMEYQQELTFYWFFILLFYMHYPFADQRDKRIDFSASIKALS
jgi:O-antigen ligase